MPLITSVGVTVAGLTATATGIGLLWTLLAPQIEQGLKMVAQLDDMVAKYYKLQSAEEWWDEARKGAGGSPPQIDPKMVDHFPGGQETLNFMWAVLRGNPPETAPALVEKFFYDARKKFNEGHEGDELDTEWHLFRANEVKNLIAWVQAHRDEVWAMLYGALTHP